MKHGRPDYNGRIVDLTALSEVEVLALIKALREKETAHPIAEDEPVFLLRASDILAPRIVREYARAYRQTAAGNETWLHHDRIIDVARDMETWQNANGHKIPDAPFDEAAPA